MIALLAGNINSSSGELDIKNCLISLKKYFLKFGSSPSIVELSESGTFYLCISPETALQVALTIKSIVAQNKPCRLNMAIGLGTIENSENGLSKASGSALDKVKTQLSKATKNNKTGFVSGNTLADDILNKSLSLMMALANNWSVNSAQVVNLHLSKPSLGQDGMSKKLKISQPAVSIRMKRAHIDLLDEMLDLYSIILKNIILP